MGWVVMLDLSRRQVFRLLKRYRWDGASAIRHKARGKPPNNRIHSAKRDYALSLIKESYADFGPTLAAEMLAEHHGFKVSRETVRKSMQEDGIWLSRKQRRTFHQPRLHRECFGEAFCLRDKRYVTKDLTLKYDRKRIRLEVNDLMRGLVGKYVDVYEMPDGRIQVRAKGVALPCTVFDPHQQRVTHALITENKHLSAVLAHIKKEQEKAAAPPKVKPVSAKNGYKRPDADHQDDRRRWKPITNEGGPNEQLGHSAKDNVTQRVVTKGLVS